MFEKRTRNLLLMFGTFVDVVDKDVGSGRHDYGMQEILRSSKRSDIIKLIGLRTVKGVGGRNWAGGLIRCHGHPWQPHQAHLKRD